jgi:hypothetical protein
MITVKISGQEREIERERDIDDNWVFRQFAVSQNPASTCPCVCERRQQRH